jgi:hypothetical protein
MRLQPSLSEMLLAILVLSLPPAMAQNIVTCPQYESSILYGVEPPQLFEYEGPPTYYKFSPPYQCPTIFPDEDSACRAGCAVEY